MSNNCGLHQLQYTLSNTVSVRLCSCRAIHIDQTASQYICNVFNELNQYLESFLTLGKKIQTSVIDSMRLMLSILLILNLITGLASANNQTDSVKPAHHTENGFRNPYIKQSDKTFFTFLKMRLTTDEWADHNAQSSGVPRQQVDLDSIIEPGGHPQITWIGHSTFLIQYRGIHLLTDPVFSTRASPLSFAGPKRYTNAALKIDQLPPIDYVVISHNHYDHLDAGTVRRLGNSTQWLVPLGHRDWFARLDVARVIEFDWWEALEVPPLKIEATPSQHWSARGLTARFEALWASWLFDFGEFRIWFAGDPGYNDIQFREIGSRFGGFDLALIPIGGYAPRWFMGPMHVNPEEAVRIHLDVNARRSTGMHWGTFPLTAEPVMEPVVRLSSAVEAANLPPETFTTLKVGETRRFEICDGNMRLVQERPQDASEC